MTLTVDRCRTIGRAGTLVAVVCSAAVLLTTGGARAQDMGQGQAQVTSKSDVQMRVESGPATNSDRLAKLTAPLGTALTAIKECYARVLKDRPTVEGHLNLTIALPQRGPVQVKVTLDELEDAEVTRCTVKAVRDAGYDQAPRPANALARLTFTHSAAAGVRMTEAREQKAEATAVHMNAAGLPEASFATPGGQVRFTVTSKKKSASDEVAATYVGLRTAIPGLLDCRRKAARHDHSPAGELQVVLWVAPNGRARAKVIHSTVESPRASACVARALGRVRFDRKAAGKTHAVIQFSAYK